MRTKVFANIALFLTALIWGLSFVAQRAGMEYVGPFTFNMARSFLGGLSLIPLILWAKALSHKPRSKQKKHRQHINLARAGLACGLALFLAMTVQQYCMQYVGAGKSGFITALYIIFVPLISILQGDKLTKNIILSVCLAVSGLYLLCYKPDNGGLSIYDLLLLLGAFLYAVQIMVVNYYSRRVDPIKACCAQFFVVGILSLLPVLIFETPTINALWACRVPLIFAGIITCGVAYTLQIWGQRYTSPVVASLIFCLESVFAVIGGVLILGESLTAKETLGCLFMISGVVLSNLNFDNNSTAQPPHGRL